jgi:hypothetical protein
MARRKVKDYHEPWTTTKDTTWEVGFRFPPVVSEYRTENDVNGWHAKKANAEKDAHWTIWASRMQPPRIDEKNGQMRVWQGQGIVGWTRNLPEAITHEEIATRLCACVNACRAVADPEKLIEDVRALLLDIVQGQTGPEDPRILSCLARLIPAEEIEKMNED